MITVHALGSTLPRPPLPPDVAANATRLREAMAPEVPEDAIVRGLLAWTYLFGAVTFELFGHLKNTVGDYTEFFEHTVDCMRQLVGLPPAP